MKPKPKRKAKRARRITRSPKIHQEQTSPDRPITPTPAESFSTTVPTTSLSEESLEDTPDVRRHLSGSGDLTGLAGGGTSSPESAAELIEEGQGREGELLNAVENARDADRGEVKVHRERRRRQAPAYKDRHRL